MTAEAASATKPASTAKATSTAETAIVSETTIAFKSAIETAANETIIKAVIEANAHTITASKSIVESASSSKSAIKPCANIDVYCCAWLHEAAVKAAAIVVIWLLLRIINLLTTITIIGLLINDLLSAEILTAIKALVTLT